MANKEKNNETPAIRPETVGRAIRPEEPPPEKRGVLPKKKYGLKIAVNNSAILGVPTRLNLSDAPLLNFRVELATDTLVLFGIRIEYFGAFS